MADVTLLVQMLVLLVATGALAGLLGVGGGIVLVPALFHGFETLGHGGPQLMQMCLATSLATIIVTSLRSLASHHRHGVVNWQTLRGWGPGIALGAIAAVLVALSMLGKALGW